MPLSAVRYARPVHRTRLLAAAGLTLITLTSCGTVQVPAGPDGSDPLCAQISVSAPQELLGLQRQETSSQGTVAWGTGEDTVVMRCGVEPPGPTTDLCTTLKDENDIETDWIVRDQDDVVFYTSYGREPAVDISVPRSVAPDQPSAAALDLGGLVSRTIEATDHCVGPGDV